MTHLKIGGKDYPFKFTWSKLLQLAKMHKVENVTDLDKIMTGMKLERLPDIVLLGLEGGAKVNGEECPFMAGNFSEEFEADQSLVGRSMAAITEDLTKAFEMPGDEAGEDSEPTGKPSNGEKYKP